MSMTYDTTETLVRRRGSIDIVIDDYVSDRQYDTPGRRDTEHTGDRRSRQIAKRHWFRKHNHGWCSGGGAWDRITVKTPKKSRGVIRKQCVGGASYID